MKGELFFVLFLVVCVVLAVAFFMQYQKGMDEYEEPCIGENSTWTASAYAEPNCCAGLVPKFTIETRIYGVCVKPEDLPGEPW